MNSTPAFFEELVVQLLVVMGYGGTIKRLKANSKHQGMKNSASCLF